MAQTAGRQRLSSALTVVMAVAALVLAWGHGSNTSARAALGNATGPLVADSLNGAAILSASGMTPGSARVGEVTVTNVGESAGDMTLGAGNLSDTSPGGGVLSQLLDLTVLDVTAGRPISLVWSGKLAALQGVALGRYEQGDAHRYRFVVSYPNNDTNAIDDAYAGAVTRVDFVWTAGQASDGGGTDGGGTTPPADTPAPDPGAAAPPAIIEDHVEQSKSPGALKLRVYVRRTQAAHRKQVYVNVFCSHACNLGATGVISLPSRHKKWTMRALKGKVSKQGTVKFKMPLPKSALAPLNTALLHRKKASVKLKITAKAGKQTLHWTRTIHLAR
jgi:hypothetical protein